MRFIVACWLMAFAVHASTQAQDTLPAGTRVRISAPAHFDGRREGVLQVEGRVWIDGHRTAPIAIPLSDVTELERFAGRRSAWLPGAVVGGVLGGTFGGLVGAGLCALSECQNSVGPIVGATAAGLVVVGAIGAGIGALMRWDSWELVAHERLVIAVHPFRGRVGVGVRLASISVRGDY